MIKVTTDDLIFYQGNKSFFSCLLKDINNDYYILIAETNGINILTELEENSLLGVIKKEGKIEIPLCQNKKGKLFTVIKLNNSEEYFTIVKVLEVIYEG